MIDLVAAFPIYDRAELIPAFDAPWKATRPRLLAAGIAAPRALTVVEDDLLNFWQRPDLLLSQTCGHRPEGPREPRLRPARRPPGHCRSARVLRADDPRQSLKAFDGAALAFNDRHSQSG